MRKFVCFILFVAFVASSYAQEIVFEGNIGLEKLQLFITRLDDQANVKAYYYPSPDAPAVQLIGSLSRDGILLEQIQGSTQETISLNGKISDSLPLYKQSFKGLWTDGQTTKDFEISKLVEYPSINYHQDEFIEAKEIYPQFLQSDYKAFNRFIQNQAQKDQYSFFTEGQQMALSGDLYNFWQQDCVTSLSYYSANYASVFKSCYSYTGGAHPNHNFQAFNLSFGNDGIREISLDNLFKKKSGYEAVISDYLIASLKKQNASAVSSGEITSFMISELTVFNVTNSGLRFSFQPY